MLWGARIQEIRKTFNLTQAEFAEKLRVSQAHISKIEKDQISPSQLLLSYICCVFYISRTWLDTGQGKMFIALEEVFKNLIAHFGERAFLEAVTNAIKENGLAVAAGRPAHRVDTGDPELNRIFNTLYDLWAAGDDKIKSWASVQFDIAIPKHIVEDILKKHAETQGKPQVS